MSSYEWLVTTMGLLIILPVVGVWGFLFYALFSYFEADAARNEAEHKLRLTRIRSGLPPR